MWNFVLRLSPYLPQSLFPVWTCFADKGLSHSTRKAILLHSLKFCINLHSQTIEQWPHLKITLVEGLFNGAQIPTWSFETVTNSQPNGVYIWLDFLGLACSTVTSWKEKFPLCPCLPNFSFVTFVGGLFPDGLPLIIFYNSHQQGVLCEREQFMMTIIIFLPLFVTERELMTNTTVYRHTMNLGTTNYTLLTFVPHNIFRFK